MAKGKTLGAYIEKWHLKKFDWEGEQSLEVLGVSNIDGITTTSHVKSEDLSGYLVIEPNTFAYNPYRINVGSIGLTPNNVFGVVSPAYIVFKVKEGKLIPELLLDFLKSFDGLQQINKYARGTVRKALRFDDLCKIQVNFPDYKKQKIIFEKKLLVEKKNSELASEIQTQKKLLTQLKQSILQEAIQGKLTAGWREQNPISSSFGGSAEGDGGLEPASELLKRIKADKAQLIKDKKIKKEKPLPPITEDEIPFELPEGWVWCRLVEISNVGTGATPLTSNKSYYENGEIPWVTSSATGTLFVEEPENFITEKALAETNCNLNPIGTLVIAMYGQGKTRGQITELKFEAATNQACATINPYLSNIELRRYVKIYFRKIYLEIRELAQGGAQPNLNMGKINNTVIPLPPIEEQKAIVEKVETLMQKCQALEQEIKTSEANAQMLMQAVLKEAFEGKKEEVYES
jgi:type I restriction enzyme, S subunit